MFESFVKAVKVATGAESSAAEAWLKVGQEAERAIGGGASPRELCEAASISAGTLSKARTIGKRWVRAVDMVAELNKLGVAVTTTGAYNVAVGNVGSDEAPSKVRFNAKTEGGKVAARVLKVTDGDRARARRVLEAALKALDAED